ncbi:MAG: hypothetical protein RBQ97_00630 [Acholeplasma sp.]|nr:hypothetical protein [Acholeplasma sp.]
MILVSIVQKQIISGVLIIIFGISIYLLIRWFLKLKLKAKKTDMLTLNMVITYRKFLEYLEYQIGEKEKFSLFLVSIENFGLIKAKESSLTSYLKKVAKALSVELPYAGKLAQTKKRDTFIIYAPNLDVTEESYAERLKHTADVRYVKDDLVILKNTNVSYVTYNNEEVSNLLEKLHLALINSKRHLGMVMTYDENNIVSYSDYADSLNTIGNSTLDFKYYEVFKIMFNQVEEVYASIIVNNETFDKSIRKFNSKDHAWLNMFLVEKLLDTLSEKKITSKINIPLTLKTIEQSNFLETLEVIMKRNNYINEQTIISLKEFDVENEQELIKNLLTLKNAGFQISYDVHNITQNLYHLIQLYHVNRLELTEEEVLSDSDLVNELLYFAKVNHLEVLVKNKDANVLKYKEANVTHVTRKTDKFTDVEDKGQRKRGRR